MNRFAALPRKPFSWSYSKLKNYEACQFKMQQVDILKNYKDESDALTEGNAVHDAFAAVFRDGRGLPVKFADYQPWVEKFWPREGEAVQVELKLAIRADFTPCEFFAKDAWFRGVVDYLKITPTGRAALAADWKTGKPLEDSIQLALFAQLLFSHFPDLMAIRTEFVWLKHDMTSREDFRRSDMRDLWAALQPRVEALAYSHANNVYVPMPGKLCRRWCPVTKCEYHGK